MTNDTPPVRTDDAAPPPFPPPTVVAAEGGRETGTFKRGFGMGAGLGLGLAVTLIGLGVVAAVASVASLATALTSLGGQEVSTEFETVWGDEQAGSTLTAVSISGPIMTTGSEGALLVTGSYGYEIADQIDALGKEDSSGLVLQVDTPGGTITGSKAISDAIVRYQDRTDQPVMVHVQGTSASGGVYSTAPADLIVADHGSLVGSIGVIFGPFQRYDGVVATSGNLLESGVTTTGGITEEYFTAGETKDFGNPYRDITQAERDMLDDILQAEYVRFVEHVSTHRGIAAATITEEMGARVYEPGRAQELGLIDDVLGREEFFRAAATRAGLDPDDTRVVATRLPSAFEAIFGVRRPVGQAIPISGSEPVSARFCDGRGPLVFAGDLATVCGG